MPVAPELNVAERTLDGRPPGGKQGGDQRAERAQGVGSRPARLADDEYLDGAQLPHFHIEIEALIDVADRIVQMLLTWA